MANLTHLSSYYVDEEVENPRCKVTYSRSHYSCRMNQDVLGLAGSRSVDQIVKGQDKNWGAEVFHFLLNDKPSKVAKHKNEVTRFCRNSL